MNLLSVHSAQLDAFPLSSASAVLNTVAQLTTTLNRLAPDLSPADCLYVMGELALVRLCLDRIEFSVKQRVEQQAKRLGLI